MKTIVLIFSALISTIGVDERYTEQMTKNIQAVYTAQTPEELQKAINLFDRIGNAEKDKWEPFYYSSFGYVMMANSEQDGTKKDALLDQAKSALDKATAITPGESEIVALEGFIQMIRITVDPATRGPQYSMMAIQLFGKAMSMNPANPRALALMAQMQFGTAKFFNQQPTEACETARKALVLFEGPVTTENPLAPNWGKGMTDEVVKNCQ